MMHKRFSRCVVLLGVLVLGTGLSLLMVKPSGAGTGKESKNQLISPARIAIGAEGNLLVSDYGAEAVVLLSKKNFKVLRTFSIAGRPLGIGWAGGRVYVGNESTGTVEVYSADGMWLYDLGGTKGNIKQPSDIAIDEGRELVFVVDGDTKTVKVFDLAGTALHSIGGSGAGQLVNPTGITIDMDNKEVFVSDYGDLARTFQAVIQIFDYAGNLIGKISGQSEGFSRPQGMAVKDGYVYLADGFLGQILVFDSASGAQVKTLGEFGTKHQQLQLPLDVVNDQYSHDIYVTNNRAGRVNRFTGGGKVR